MTGQEALQECLAAEHAAMYGYGVLGGVLAGVAPGSPEQSAADASYAAHRDRRGVLTALLVELRADPVAAEPAYATPFSVVSLADCRRLARAVEERSAHVYAGAVANTVDDVRALTSAALTDCALRHASWGGTPVPLPGID